VTPVVASKKVYIKTYKEFLKETVHYKVNADKINVLTYDKKGKLSEEKVFKGLTKEEKKLDYDYERDDRDDKKLSFLGEY
jgi:ribosomal protein L23